MCECKILFDPPNKLWQWLFSSCTNGKLRLKEAKRLLPSPFSSPVTCSLPTDSVLNVQAGLSQIRICTRVGGSCRDRNWGDTAWPVSVAFNRKLDPHSVQKQKPSPGTRSNWALVRHLDKGIYLDKDYKKTFISVLKKQEKILSMNKQTRNRKKTNNSLFFFFRTNGKSGVEKYSVERFVTWVL